MDYSDFASPADLPEGMDPQFKFRIHALIEIALIGQAHSRH